MTVFNFSLYTVPYVNCLSYGGPRNRDLFRPLMQQFVVTVQQESNIAVTATTTAQSPNMSDVLNTNQIQIHDIPTIYATYFSNFIHK